LDLIPKRFLFWNEGGFDSYVVDIDLFNEDIDPFISDIDLLFLDIDLFFWISTYFLGYQPIFRILTYFGT
jgi:hypothetical protein